MRLLTAWGQSPSARNAELLADMNDLADELTTLTAMITAFDDDPDVGLEERTEEKEDDVPVEPTLTSSDDTTARIVVSHPPSDTLVYNAPAPIKRRSSIYRHAFFLACSSKRKQRLRVRESAKEATRRSLESPKLWKEHQNKSFQHHIARQKLARQQQEQEKERLEAKQAARFERASTLRDNVPAKPLSKLPKCLYNSYLGRFRQDRPVNLKEHKHKQEVQAKAQALEAQEGCLCGVYLHGKRRKDMVYITTTSLLQLKERITSRLPGSKVLNVYKERVAVVANDSADEAQNAFYLERITRFSQIKDGDRLCVTQNAYEDMAILCDWMKRRQRLMYHIEHRPVPRPCSPPKPASSSPSKNSPVRKLLDGYSALFTESKKPQVWDQNGRVMSVKQQFPV